MTLNKIEGKYIYSGLFLMKTRFQVTDLSKNVNFVTMG